ncbi:hypothetical protein GCM10028818_52530 [Spirosoma horti]
MNPKTAINEILLRQELAKQDFELIKALPQQPNHKLEVQANKYEPVSVDNIAPIYMPLPVTLQVTLDADNKIDKIDGGQPSGEAVADAKQFLQMLMANNQLDGLSEKPQPNATHQIALNEKGQRVIKRRRFSAY